MIPRKVWFLGGRRANTESVLDVRSRHKYVVASVHLELNSPSTKLDKLLLAAFEAGVVDEFLLV
jgi:hypothetical protein